MGQIVHIDQCAFLAFLSLAAFVIHNLIAAVRVYLLRRMPYRETTRMIRELTEMGVMAGLEDREAYLVAIGAAHMVYANPQLAGAAEETGSAKALFEAVIAQMVARAKPKIEPPSRASPTGPSPGENV